MAHVGAPAGTAAVTCLSMSLGSAFTVVPERLALKAIMPPNMLAKDRLAGFGVSRQVVQVAGALYRLRPGSSR